MKYILSLLLLTFTFLNSFSQVHVNGYYRKNGTYVQPYTRSSPDGNPYNNYTYPGNVNPYTGKIAPGNPSTYLNNYYNKSSSTNNSYNNSTNNNAAYNYARVQTYQIGRRKYTYFSYILYKANYYQIATSYPRYSTYKINDNYGYTVGYAVSKSSKKYTLYDTTISEVGYVKMSNRGYCTVYDNTNHKLYSNKPRGRFIPTTLAVIATVGLLVVLSQ